MSNKINLFSQFSSVSEAMRWCKTLMHIMKPFISNNGACIVIDIDGTLLNSTTQRAIQPVVDVAQFAYQNKIPIHIVTARIDVNNNRLITIEQLAHIGLKPRHSKIGTGQARPVAYYESLSMRSVREFQNNNFSGFKYRVRCNLPQPVLLNIGDQWDDLIRRPPYCTTKREQTLFQELSRLPSRNIYIGQLSDCSWFSVKVPFTSI